MNAKFASQMEIAFWNLFIYNLSEKEWVRRFVRFFYHLLPRTSLRDSLKLIGAFAAAGFASGILFYVVVINYL